MEVDGSEPSKPDVRNLKYIKPLLGASSRLGRTLAELFGLLVKLCVGSPVRQRRGQNNAAAHPIPSVHARKVSDIELKLTFDGKFSLRNIQFVSFLIRQNLMLP